MVSFSPFTAQSFSESFFDPTFLPNFVLEIVAILAAIQLVSSSGHGSTEIQAYTLAYLGAEESAG